MTAQAFKENDLTEAKITACFAPLLDEIDLSRDQFNDGAYECFKLGEVLLALDRSPAVGVVSDDVFIQSFFAIHEFFTRPGTFEFYLDIFKNIWGEDVEIEFTVPAPGKLLINIEALDSVPALAIAREIVADVYVNSDIVDHDGDNLIFQTTQGIKTQREADALVRELNPAGIWVDVTLTIS